MPYDVDSIVDYVSSRREIVDGAFHVFPFFDSVIERAFALADASKIKNENDKTFFASDLCKLTIDPQLMKASGIQTMTYEECRSWCGFRYMDFSVELGIFAFDPYFFSLHCSPYSTGCFSQ